MIVAFYNFFSNRIFNTVLYARILRFSILCLLLSASNTWAAFTCQHLYNSIAPLAKRLYTMEAGDEVVLNGDVPAAFIGSSKSHFYFLKKNNGQVISYRRKEMSGVPDSARPLHVVMTDPVSESCAVISTISCLKVLNEMNGLSHPELIKGMNPTGFFDRMARFDLTIFEFIANEGVHPAVAKTPEVQLASRMRFFKNHGIPAERTNELAKLRDHVQKGYPAIIDGPVRVIEKPTANILTVEIGTMPVHPADATTDGHSVMAFRWLTLSSGEEKVLIYDPYTRHFDIWDAKVLGENAGTSPPKTEFTLVFPAGD